MPRIRSWTDESLIDSVKARKSYRSVLIDLHLIPAGGNYQQIMRRIAELNISTDHFTGKGWNRDWKFDPRIPAITLEKLLVENSYAQSYGVKKRLFKEGLKKPECELCEWAQKADDGRIPVELDHINGDRKDNRLENLRVLCPNCHSLQATHRGKNKKVRLRAGVVIGSQV